MNTLAHYILSKKNEEVIVGNVIADFIKGNTKFNFSENILKGIELHKKIDLFSDHHASVKATWTLIQDDFGHYGRVITDIYYDHFLCKHWADYSKNSFDEDIKFLYACLKKHASALPPGVRRMSSRIMAYNWPYKYSEKAGLYQVFRSMSRRVKFENKFENAVKVLEKEYDVIHSHFLEFFPELHDYVQTVFKELKIKKK